MATINSSAFRGNSKCLSASPAWTLDVTSHNHFIKVLKDNITIVYTGKGSHSDDYGVIFGGSQAQEFYHIGMHNRIWYYEISIVNTHIENVSSSASGETAESSNSTTPNSGPNSRHRANHDSPCEVTIGFASRALPNNMSPAMQPFSYCWDGATGKVYGAPAIGRMHFDSQDEHNDSSSVSRLREIGVDLSETTSIGRDVASDATWVHGDVVGCGVDTVSRSMFFTKNGKLIAKAFQGITIYPICEETMKSSTHAIVPTISLHSPSFALRVNFGSPFLFDLSSHLVTMSKEWEEPLKQIHVHADIIASTVKAYLEANGFTATLAALDEEKGMDRTTPRAKTEHLELW